MCVMVMRAKQCKVEMVPPPNSGPIWREPLQEQPTSCHPEGRFPVGGCFAMDTATHSKLQNVPDNVLYKAPLNCFTVTIEGVQGIVMTTPTQQCSCT